MHPPEKSKFKVQKRTTKLHFICKTYKINKNLLSFSQEPDESFGMNVAGGKGSDPGDLPIFISALRPDSVAGRCGQIQVE